MIFRTTIIVNTCIINILCILPKILTIVHITATVCSGGSVEQTIITEDRRNTEHFHKLKFLMHKIYFIGTCMCIFQKKKKN